MNVTDFIRAMPKVELHVHLEGSIQPETLLELACRNGVALPAEDVDGLRRWFTFTDFNHFIEVYGLICRCICTADDVEWIAREFLRGQAAQRILYSEVIFTPYTHAHYGTSIPFSQQMDALAQAATWAANELQVEVAWVPDIARAERPVEHGLTVADWAISAVEQGVVALGLGGPEVGYPPELFEASFDRIRAAGLFSLPHAGETEGPASIWGAIDTLGATRIGHGVRCLEDPVLVDHLRKRQIPLDVSPSSNVCLKVVDQLADHPLPRLLSEGLLVTLNSDDPALFNTTLTDEYLRVAETFDLGRGTIKKLALNGVRASLLPRGKRTALESQFQTEFTLLESETLNPDYELIGR